MSRYFILGSCVTRDAFGEGSSAPGVAEYFARSPLGSMFADRPELEHPNFSAIESNFQRRMVEADWMKRVPRLLQETPYDYVLLDLIDERFDLAEAGGSVYSVSNELRLTGYNVGDAAIARFGSRRHQELFEEGFSKLVEQVGSHRVIVSKAFWATQLADGTPTGSPAYIEAANATLQRLYEYVGQYDLRWIEYPADVLIGDPSHKWGVSPFHFVPEFYTRLRSELADHAIES